LSDKLGVYHRLIRYLFPYWKQIFLAYAGMFASIALNLIVPSILREAIDTGITSGVPTALYWAGGLILVIAVARGLASFAELFFGEWLTHRVAFDLRNQFYDRVQHLPFAFHDKSHTGDLMSRATSDIGETERFVGIGLAGLISTILMVIGVVIVMLWVDLELALLSLIPMPVLVILALRFGDTVRNMFKTLQEQVGIVSNTMQESMTGIRVVKAFAREPYELEKFDKVNEDYFQLRYDLVREWGNNWPRFNFVVALSIFLLLWFGGPRALAGDVTVGTLFAMISYVTMLNYPVQRLGFQVNLAATAGASATRVFEIIDTPNEVEDRENGLEMPPISGSVTFQNVDFAYKKGRNILHDISFTVAPGETVALIGPTGSGKSTLTNLIPRFYEPTSGSVLVDGVDVRHMTMKSLRQHIGMVLQDPFLFSQTIAQNIAYGRPTATHDEIVEAAKAARADKFIMEFPEGYETRVGERGVTLSGGQKQRIAIARALLADPRILILDDSTSSVDTETEYLIQQALEILMEGRTTFIIAQRLQTLKNAGNILVLNHGKIVERGKHDFLLSQNGLYREIYDLQLKDQEAFVALQASMG
jgi:ATP-binding cassette subfamily B protein